MRKLLISITLTVTTLLAATGFAALDNCSLPSDDNWSSYCSCFLDQAMKACDSCSVTTCRPKSKEAVKYNILHSLTPSLMRSTCERQASANVGNSCLAPGVDADACINNINLFREHCA
jgi:hypothetical protein